MNSPANPSYKIVFTVSLRGQTLQLTREGSGFVFLVFGVGLGAINTGNNLLYLVLAMCCSFIAISGLLSEWTLKQVTVKGKLPPTFHAGEATPLVLSLANAKSSLPSYALRVYFPNHKTLFKLEKEISLFYLAPASSTDKTVMMSALRRGPLQIDQCQLATSFPFGFFIKSKTVPIQIEALVLPRLYETTAPMVLSKEVEGDGKKRQSGSEVHSLREFSEGDSPQSIHWKSSAKTGGLRVKEFGQNANRSCIVPLHFEENELDPFDEKRIEEKISKAASQVFHMIRQGVQVQLKTDDMETDFASTESHLENIMQYLAKLSPQTQHHRKADDA
ncbi:MAG: DUF58 domain-containing protein [Candidatus Nitrohelix vancouverensis]|uniref:DUF58 domain-containing protein n=1 Tax=Candidatus Nitrohelix vancouverensis TaxID=2705534 RepID=A0A7T0C3Y3_9BACT|nr:MAG: DUF58 domain-containing protein [Candidatus Nitrohelix vancouverensis]